MTGGTMYQLRTLVNRRNVVSKPKEIQLPVKIS